MTPPFKPSVESDESVANFDPEFTSADVRDAGPDEMDLDEEDPSEDWVALTQSVTAGSLHTPNGPLGSDRPPGATVAAPAAPASAGIQIAPKKKKKRDIAESPLTNSVQENFRGFTYHGESVMPAAAGVLVEAPESAEEHVVTEESETGDAETDYDDEERPAGWSRQ